MAYLTRDAILAKDDSAFADVEVPEWGGTVRVRTITGSERDQFDEQRERFRSGGANVGTRAFLVGMATCDEQGNRLFRPDDLVALGKKSMAALDRVFDVACRLNGIGLKAVEDAEKN